MPLFVGLDVPLKTTSICIVEADGSQIWEGKAESEPAMLIKALILFREKVTRIGIEACPLSEWLYSALVDSGFRRSASRRGMRNDFCRPARTKLTVVMLPASPR